MAAMAEEDRYSSARQSLMERGTAILAARAGPEQEDSAHRLEQGSHIVPCALPEQAVERRGGMRWRHTAAIVACALVLCLSLVAVATHGSTKRVVSDSQTEDLLLSAAHAKSTKAAAAHRIAAKHTALSAAPKAKASKAKTTVTTVAAKTPRAAPKIVVQSTAQAAPLKPAAAKPAAAKEAAPATQKAASKLSDGRFQAQIDRFTEDYGGD